MFLFLPSGSNWSAQALERAESVWIVVAIISAVVLLGGLIGEYSEIEGWKKTRRYKLAKWAVIIGVLGELIGDAGIFETSDALQQKTDAAITAQLPRNLTPEQQDAIAKELSKWATAKGMNGRQRVAIFPTSSEFEAAHLADLIAAALGPKGAGWDVNRNPVTYGKSFAVSGVALMVAKSSRALAVASDLRHALMDAKILSSILPVPGMDCAAIHMTQSLETDPACSAISVWVGSHP